MDNHDTLNNRFRKSDRTNSNARTTNNATRIDRNQQSLESKSTWQNEHYTKSGNHSQPLSKNGRSQWYSKKERSETSDKGKKNQKKADPPSGNRKNKNKTESVDKQNSNRRSNNKVWDPGGLSRQTLFNDPEALQAKIEEGSKDKEPILINEWFKASMNELIAQARELEVTSKAHNSRDRLYHKMMLACWEKGIPLHAEGIFESREKGGRLLYQECNYKVKSQSIFIHQAQVEQYGLKPGHQVLAQIHPGLKLGQCPFALKILTLFGLEPEKVQNVNLFEDLTPYYPLERILLENDPNVKWDNVSMRTFDLLTPIGLGQRGLIVAPPRTGKTVLLQSIANTIVKNRPEAHLIVLLVDERPEEVTDFSRQVPAEVVSSTFDEPAESHVHLAETVIEKARRMVEIGRHVIILLDSITRLARAYNTTMPNSGKILSGGMEASALQRPKRFFGSARNIEGGGSLTIIGTALIETGSRMDEVIFEEFKGTGNMELHLDRALADKRIFPAINLERSGTRKEELLYHPQEMEKIYSLRRAMKGVPSPEAMEMLIGRIKKTKTNAEFLVTLNR